MANAITIPSVQVNGQYLGIVPNSLKVIRGKGTTEVKAQSFGSSVQPVFETNQEEAIGHITVQVYPTDTTINQIRQFQDLGSTLRVDIIDPESGTPRSMRPAVVCNDPNLELGADQTITVEFKGSAVV